MRILIALLGLVVLCGHALAQNSATGFAPGDGASAIIVDLQLTAQLTHDGKPIKHGMTWRVFGDREDSEGKLPMIASAEGGSAQFQLPTGTYLVHAAFGRAGATKRVSLDANGSSETFVLQAGGLELNATADGKEIDKQRLRFSIYELEQDEEGERKLIALNVAADKIIRLNAGTYHVLSRYGTINATVRADLEVKAGKVTRAVLQHRGAQVSMRLVSEAGGAPIANTAWTVFTNDGEKVFESTNIAPTLVLAEGGYEAAVRYGDRTFRKSFSVGSGTPIELEVPLEES